MLFFTFGSINGLLWAVTVVAYLDEPEPPPALDAPP